MQTHATHATREQWLEAAAAELLALVIMPTAEEAGIKAAPPPVKVSCGYARGQRSAKTLGVCYPRAASPAGVNEIFISPELDDSATVAVVLLHELIHALDDCKHGHKGRFATVALAVGFSAPLTTYTPSDALTEIGDLIRSICGDYPHAHLIQPAPKTGQNRQKKLACTQCGAILRASAAVISAMPTPALCPCCETRNLRAE